MLRELTRVAVVVTAALGAVPVRTADGAPPCNSGRVDVEPPVRADATPGSLLPRGNPPTVRVEACQATITALLSALSTYGISYRSSIALNEIRNGAYAGSVGQVIARVLDGYSYVIKHDGSHLGIVIYGRKGESAVAAPIVTQVSQAPERVPHQTSRNR